VARLVFMLLILPWFQVIFRVVWCEREGDCQGKAYLQVRADCVYIHGKAVAGELAALLLSF
jgi:hypothetical protein